MEIDLPMSDIEKYIANSLERSRIIFENYPIENPVWNEEINKATKVYKAISRYPEFLPKEWLKSGQPQSNALSIYSGSLVAIANIKQKPETVPKKLSDETLNKVVDKLMDGSNQDPQMVSEIKNISEKALMIKKQDTTEDASESSVPFSHGLIPYKAPIMPKPMWHPPWKLMRVISGHTGWVRCLAVEPGNQWFATGSADRMIKIWDLASGTLKLSLTGHISTVRGLVVSSRHPYLFSCGEDKTIKCWDLEQNKSIRHYHGHLHSVYCMAMHPTIDVLVTGSRDATVRVWDIRTKACAFTMTGHTSTVASVCTQALNPQIVSGSHDNTIRLWDLTTGKSYCTLTHHKRSVRSVIFHPKTYCMVSASPESIKQWKLPDGELIQTLRGHNAIINALAINEDDVLVSGGDNGSMHFWDWKTGYNFDSKQSIVQPGSLDSEAGIFALGFDHSGTRLISCEADKSIKIFKEDENATEETHPIKYRPDIIKYKRF